MVAFERLNALAQPQRAGSLTLLKCLAFTIIEALGGFEPPTRLRCFIATPQRIDSNLPNDSDQLSYSASMIALALAQGR